MSYRRIEDTRENETQEQLITENEAQWTPKPNEHQVKGL